MYRPIRLILAALVPACSGRRTSDAMTVDTTMVFVSTPAAARSAARLHVSLTKGGRVFADGQEVTLKSLDSLLSATQRANGGVWLYQESGAPGSDSVFKQVVAAALSHQLPVWFAHRPDFSDLEATLGHTKKPSSCLLPNMRLKLTALLLKEALCCLMLSTFAAA